MCVSSTLTFPVQLGDEKPIKRSGGIEESMVQSWRNSLGMKKQASTKFANQELIDVRCGTAVDFAVLPSSILGDNPALVKAGSGSLTLTPVRRGTGRHSVCWGEGGDRRKKVMEF